AHEAMKAALVAAGASVEESEEFMMKINAQIDFDDIQSQIDQQAVIIGQKINDAVNNSVPGAEMGWGERGVRWFTGDDDLTVAARESAQKAADSWWATYMSLDEEKRKEHFNNLSKAVAESQTKAFNMVNSDLRSLMNEAHIQTPQQLLEVYKAITTFTEDQSELVMKHPEAARALVGNMTDEMKDALELAYQTEETVAQRVAGNANISGDKLDSIKTLKDLLPNLAMSEMSVAEATNNYAAALMAADYAGRALNE